MPPSHSSSAPWFAFLLGAFLVVAGFAAYAVYAGAGYNALQSAESVRPPLYERRDLPALPIPLPRADAD